MTAEEIAAAAAAAAATTTTTTEAASTAASAASGTAAAATAAAGSGDAASGAAAAAAAAVVAPVVPANYDLKLPDGSTLDAAIVQRTAATARALGLTNEAGQKLLDATIAELTTTTTAAADAAKAAQLEAMKPGGAVWTEREAAWRTQSLADKEVGGSPEKLQASADLAGRVIGKFATPEAKQFFQDTGFGSHPEMLRLLTRIGRVMAEGSLVLGGPQDAARPGTAEERMARSIYTHPTSKSA